MICLFFTKSILLISVFAGCNGPVIKRFPNEADPLFIGNKLAYRYTSESFRNFDGIASVPGEVTYPEVCAWFGALKFAQAAGDDQLLAELEERFYPLLGPKKHLMQKPDHVDHTFFGTIPLQLYRQTGQECFFYLGIDFADRQWQRPQTSNAEKAKKFQDFLDNGLSWQTRYWIDDMFMISAIQTQAYLCTEDEKYLNRAAYQMSVYLDTIQQSNGLFYHSGSAPFFWCRGNGWMAAGMTELLTHLPEDNIYYKKIMRGYLLMIESLKNLRNDEGLWGQLIDDRESWTET